MPPNGTWTSAPAVWGFTWRIPASASWTKRCAFPRSDVKVVADVLEDGGRDEVGGVVDAFAAGDERTAFLPSTFDGGKDVVELLLVHDRPHLGLGIGGVADGATFDPLEESLPEIVVGGVLDVDPPRRG